jgi:hypothetical protein
MERDSLDDFEMPTQLPPLRDIRSGEVERASQDAAWRILQASDLVQRRMRAFEDRLANPASSAQGLDPGQLEALFDRLDAAQADRLAALETRLLAQQPASNDEALNRLAEGVKASFDAVAGELANVRDSVETLARQAAPQAAPAKPPGAAIQNEFETLINNLHDAVAACIHERAALSDAAAALSDGQMLKAFVAASEQPLRSLSQDLQQIDQRLQALESRPLPEITLPAALQPKPVEVLSPAAQVKLWEPERANLHRMMVAYNLMLKRMNEGVEAFEHQLQRIGQRPWPDSESMARLFSAIEEVSGKVDPLPQAMEAVRQKVGETGVPPTLLAEKNQLQQLIVGFRMVAADFAREADRFAGTTPTAAPSTAATFDTGDMTSAIAEVIASAEMRIDQSLRSFAMEQAAAAEATKAGLAKLLALPAAPAETAVPEPASASTGKDRLSEAVFRTESAARLIEQCRKSVAEQISELESSVKSGSPADAKLLKSELNTASEAFERETASFLALSAALSKELADARRARGEPPAMAEARSMQKHRRIRA